MVRTMNLNNLNMNAKIEELLSTLNKKEEEKEKNTVLWVLAIIGAVAAVAGIAFAVYQIIWRILKKISTTTLMIISRTKKSKQATVNSNLDFEQLRQITGAVLL